jgi:hypothetical protein
VYPQRGIAVAWVSPCQVDDCVRMRELLGDESLVITELVRRLANLDARARPEGLARRACHGPRRRLRPFAGRDKE